MVPSRGFYLAGPLPSTPSALIQGACSGASLVLWDRSTSPVRASSACVLRLPAVDLANHLNFYQLSVRQSIKRDENTDYELGFKPYL